MSRWVLIGIIVFAAWTATIFLLGRQSKTCPQVQIQPGTETPVTKPLEPDTVWLPRVVLRIDTLRVTDSMPPATDTVWREPKPFYRQTAVFADRWPHTGDTLFVDTAKMEATLIPFGFITAPTTHDARFAIPAHRPLLEVGYAWSFGGADALFASVPNPLRDRRLVYWPHRLGVEYQFEPKRWGLRASWTVW